MEELAWLHERPALVRLFHPDDVPHPAARFPRPLTPEQDRLIQQELLRRNDVTSNALLLIRHTGIRIGECVDLSFDCLRALAPGQWALHVPLGKLNTERVVPIDDSVCQLVHRLRFFRFLSAVPPDGLLLARRRNRSALLRELRTALTQVRTALGIARPIVPHMFRHTFATEMMRSGVSFAALMKLLGHSIAENDPALLRVHADRSTTRVPCRSLPAPASRASPKAATSTIGLKPDLTSTLHALQVAQHVLEMFRRTLSDTSGDHAVLDRLFNRLTKIAAELRKLAPEWKRAEIGRISG